MSNPITFRPWDKVREILENFNRGKRSDVINEAVRYYIEQRPMDDEILKQIKELKIDLDEIKNAVRNN